MTLHLAITTYNRPEMLARLLKQVRREAARSPLHVAAHVYDDGSDTLYSGLVTNGCRYVRTEHHGKRAYWRLVTRVFRDAKITAWDYFMLLPDDVTLAAGFFDKARALYDGIDDDKKACLNLMVDSRGHCLQWTPVEPEQVGKVWRTGWMDLCVLSSRDMLEALRWHAEPVGAERWAGNPLLGSGVGSQLSRRLVCDIGLNLYQVDKTLVHHGGHESVMNKEARKRDVL